MQVSVVDVQAQDGSEYTILPPPIKGIIPRLAAEMLIDKVNLVVDREDMDDLLVSR